MKLHAFSLDGFTLSFVTTACLLLTVGLHRRSSARMFAAVMLMSGVTPAFCLVSMAAEPPQAFDDSGPVVRGSDESLEVRLHGSVVDEKGNPVADPKVTVTLRAIEGTKTIGLDIRGNQFEVWLPTSGLNWYRLELECRRGDETAYRVVNRYRIRQAAIDGINIKLQKPAKSTDIVVQYKDQPVANAKVKVQMEHSRIVRGTTDDGGVLRVDLYPNEKLSSLTAWTEDYLFGGFQFMNPPLRDRDASSHTIELNRCRDQTIRMVDVDGEPIEGVEFQMNIATRKPYFNFLGVVDDALLRTDANGESVLHWFPDWPEVHQNADLQSQQWFVFEKPKRVDDVLVTTLKPRIERKRVMGIVVGNKQSLAGISVELQSFQAERDGQFDRVYGTTNESGQFWVDVLPGSTYSACVNDVKFVSDSVNGVLYDLKTQQANSPIVTLKKGAVAKVKLTTGSERTPMPDVEVSFRSSYRFTWDENGKSRTGFSARDFSSTTNAEGIASAVVFPGTVTVGVYQPEWRPGGSIEVVDGGDNFIELHRKLAEPKSVSGRLVVADADDVNLAECQLSIGSLDGQTRDQRDLQCDQDGKFSLKTLATKLGVLAITQDEKYAGAVVARDLSESIIVTMHPTETMRGQLIDADGKPVTERTITAYATLEDDEDTSTVDSSGVFTNGGLVNLANWSLKTNERGEFAFTGLPCFIPISFSAEGDLRTREQVYLEPGEVRPPTVWKLKGKNSKEASRPKSISRVWSEKLRDCMLNGYRPMIIVASESDEANQFIDLNLKNGSINSVLARFVTLRLTPDQLDAEFLERMDLKVPSDGDVFVVVCDPLGIELQRATFGINDANIKEQVAEFVLRNAPAKVDVKQAWDAAFAIAKKTDRSVWVRIGSHYCRECFALSCLLDDHEDALSQDYVMLQLEDIDRANFPEIYDRLPLWEQTGITFHGIFDASGMKLIDSVGPLGNIGYPTSFEGKRHLRRMLQTTRKRMTDEQIDAIIDTSR
ncbi:thioredoxin family protein [Novipirellula sp. SH528]|uniref:thioredoxin family protein n=1 Tax=Novipirellula sp. SH528 TaxID=3454466 RepID=UPI003F9F80C3